MLAARDRRALRRGGGPWRAGPSRATSARCGRGGAGPGAAGARRMRSARPVRRRSVGQTLAAADGRRLSLGARAELHRADPRVHGALAAARGARGRIVNVVSVAGTCRSSVDAYSCSKHAALAWSRALVSAARAHGVTVTTANPGPVPTPGFPQSGIVGHRVGASLLLIDAARCAEGSCTPPIAVVPRCSCLRATACRRRSRGWRRDFVARVLASPFGLRLASARGGARPHDRRRPVALVTGGSSGIGLALAERLAGRGMTVLLAARGRAPGCRRRSSACPESSADGGGHRRAVRPRPARRGGTAALAARSARQQRRSGGGATAIDIDMARASRVLEINFLAHVGLTRALWDDLRRDPRARRERVVGLGTYVHPRSAAYAASKHALTGWSRALRIKGLREGVHVLTLNPGPVVTAQFTHEGWQAAIRPLPADRRAIAAPTMRLTRARSRTSRDLEPSRLSPDRHRAVDRARVLRAMPRDREPCSYANRPLPTKLPGCGRRAGPRTARSSCAGCTR